MGTTLPNFSSKTDIRAYAKSKSLELFRDKEELYNKQLSICSKIEALKEFYKAQNILTYFPLTNEFDLNSLVISNPDKKWFLPRPIGKRKMLILGANDLFELKKEKYDLMVPAANSELINAKELDMIIIPGLAFDKKFYRLGRGAGYYDSLLEKIDKKCFTVGVSFKELVLDELPNEDHDKKLDLVISV